MISNALKQAKNSIYQSTQGVNKHKFVTPPVGIRFDPLSTEKTHNDKSYGSQPRKIYMGEIEPNFVDHNQISEKGD